MYRNNKIQRIKQAGATAAVAVGLVAGGVGIASATSTPGASSTNPQQSAPIDRGALPGGPPPGGPGVRPPGGEVSALTNDLITVSTPDGSSLVFALSSSTVIEKGHQSSSRADLAVGERVRIRPASPGSSVAAGIDIVVPHLAGRVISVSAGTIVISDADGFHRTIDVNSSTSYTKNASASNVAAVTIGSFIAAEGTIDANHTTLSATSIGVGMSMPPNGHDI